MKKYIATCLLIPAILFANPTIGLNALAGYSMGTGKSTSDLNLGPSLHLSNKKGTEFVTSIFWGYSGISYSDNQDYNLSQISLGTLFGIYYRIYSSELFKFSMGPDISFAYFFAPKTKVGGSLVTPDKYAKADLMLGMPLNFDMNFSKIIALRCSYRIFSMDGSYANGNGYFSVCLKSLPAPTFSLLYSF